MDDLPKTLGLNRFKFVKYCIIIRIKKYNKNFNAVYFNTQYKPLNRNDFENVTKTSFSANVTIPGRLFSAVRRKHTNDRKNMGFHPVPY